MRRNVIIMGAAGRDFHNFNVFFRNNRAYDIVAFTATQIPGIAGRKYPQSLAGSLYPRGIPIFPEETLAALIKKFRVDEVVFAYSDVWHEDVMHKASLALAAGADFILLGPNSTMLRSTKHVISVCAVRTGAGKSQTTRAVAKILQSKGKRVVVIRHPMPYGDLAKQAVQRFSSYEDLKSQNTTIEEREEYEPHIEAGTVVYAGVDYERILRAAEKEADIVLWDGGNNDFSFIRPDFSIVVADPHRAGHEMRYHPGEANLRMADVIIINKVDSARKEDVAAVERNAKAVNPKAKIILAKSGVTIGDPSSVNGKTVLVVGDGPTLTHGGMAFGAGSIAAKKYGCRIIDGRKYAKGSLKEVYAKYPSLTELPAMGYGKKQTAELQATINAVPCDAVLDASPADLSRLMKINKPVVRVRYELAGDAVQKLKAALRKAGF